MARERNIADEQILYALIAARKDDAKANLVENVEVDEADCMAVGIFNYKDIRTGKKVATRLYFIAETVDGELRNIIYDETGRPIAWQEEEEGMELQVAGDVRLDRNLLRKQLVLADERAKNGLPAPGEGGENKAGEGRDLAKKEHEKTQEEKPKEEETNEEKKEEEKEESEEAKGEEETEEQETTNKKLRNLKYEINIDNNPKIALDEIINGHYLWQILGLDEKLNGKLPDDLDPTAFRSGFLSFVDSHELDLADEHKLESNEVEPRLSPETFVVQTISGDIIELDDTVLKRKELGTSIEKQKAEQSNLRFEDGEEAEKPETNMVATRTSLYEIPNVSEKFSVGENWYLGIDEDEGYKRNDERPTAGHKKNVSFIQVSRNESYYNREVRIQNTLEYKLKAIDEPPAISKREIRQQEQLRKKSSSETEEVREQHNERLVDKCFKKYPNLGEYFNSNDITSRVEKYHNQGASDNEILRQIGEDVIEAEETEHTRPLPGEGKRSH